MNHFVVQQNTREETTTRDFADTVVCPTPRRLAILPNNHTKHHPLRWHQTELSDHGADLLDIIFNKGSEQCSAHMASSPPFFSGSPPSRASNPLIKDALFREEKLSPMAALPAAYSRSSPPHKGGGCARMKFGLKPAAVRVEGFDCLNRDCQNSRVSAVA